MFTDIDEYFAKGCGRCERFDTPDCSMRRWSAGLFELRRVCRDSGSTRDLEFYPRAYPATWIKPLDRLCDPVAAAWRTRLEAEFQKPHWRIR